MSYTADIFLKPPDQTADGSIWGSLICVYTVCIQFKINLYVIKGKIAADDIRRQHFLLVLNLEGQWFLLYISRLVLSAGCVAVGTVAVVYSSKSKLQAAAASQSWMAEPVTDLETLEKVCVTFSCIQNFCVSLFLLLSSDWSSPRFKSD